MLIRSIWEEMCPKPSDDVMMQVKKDKTEKQKETIARMNARTSATLQEKEKKKSEKGIQKKTAQEAKEKKKIENKIRGLQ
jgi:hypothetical protein